MKFKRCWQQVLSSLRQTQDKVAHHWQNARRNTLAFLKQSGKALNKMLHRLGRSFVKLGQALWAVLGNFLQFLSHKWHQGLANLRQFYQNLQAQPPASTPPASTVPRPTRQRLNSLKGIIQKLSHNLIASMLLLVCFGFMVFFFVPASLTFEGNLNVEEVSFTYNGEPNKLFLNSIRNLQRIEIEGQQSLSILGQFSSADNPNLNALDTLEINLNDRYSKLIIEPVNLENSDLELSKLRLQPQTQVQQLFYNTQENQLSFALEVSDTAAPQENLIPVQLALGMNPLKVIIEGYQSPQLPNDISEFNILEFVWNPISSELNLSLATSASFYLTLPDLQTINSNQWIWGNLEVKNVRFYRVVKTEDIQDDLEISTILNGRLRFREKEVTLDSQQFLIFEPKQGVNRFPRLQISPDNPPGLQIRIHGQASTIAVGLDRQFPVSRIQSNLIEKWLPRDLINVLLTFSAVAIGYILPWLFTQKS